MRDLYSNDVETAAQLARDEQDWDDDRPTLADVAESQCEHGGHCWEDAGGGLQICMVCEAERWADETPEPTLPSSLPPVPIAAADWCPARNCPHHCGVDDCTCRPCNRQPCCLTRLRSASTTVTTPPRASTLNQPSLFAQPTTKEATK